MTRCLSIITLCLFCTVLIGASVANSQTAKRTEHQVIWSKDAVRTSTLREIEKLKLTPQAKRRLVNVADRVLAGIRPASDPVPIPRFRELMAQRFGALTKAQQLRLRKITARRTDEKFIGVIDSMNIGGRPITLERRFVHFGKGVVRAVLLNKMGDHYVLDGDMIVSPSALIAGQLIAQGANFSGSFAAGIAGAFGEGPLWDDAVIPFEVTPFFCCTAALTAAIAEIEARTVFRFIPRDGHANYIEFINSELFLSSMAELGKQQGENEVRIQGFAFDGTPRSLTSRTRTIIHEIGHELGMIHEHLRQDRDKFIARNPNCTPTNFFQSIYEGWIDLTNVAFVDNQAELFTEYDPASIMHYSFLLAPADGSPTCFAWVLLSSCPDRDPADPACTGNFGSNLPTNLDIEGLHRLYIGVPGVEAMLNAPGQIRSFTGDNIRHNGARIYICLLGGEAFQGCSQENRKRVADEFCQTQGFQSGFNLQLESLEGEHSAYHVELGWITTSEEAVLSAVTCENLTPVAQQVEDGILEERTFEGDEVVIGPSGIDRCAHGDGVTGHHCSEANKQLIADKFCTENGYERSSLFETGMGWAFFSTHVGYFPETDDFQGVLASFDKFTQITCVRAA